MLTPSGMARGSGPSHAWLPAMRSSQVTLTGSCYLFRRIRSALQPEQCMAQLASPMPKDGAPAGSRLDSQKVTSNTAAGGNGSYLQHIV